LPSIALFMVDYFTFFFLQNQFNEPNFKNLNNYPNQTPISRH